MKDASTKDKGREDLNISVEAANSSNFTSLSPSSSSKNPNCRPSCEQDDHRNIHCRCNTSDDERAEMLKEYLKAIEEVAPNIRLLPLGEDKAPKIMGQCRLHDNEAIDMLHTPNEAIDALRDGHPGFAIYAGNETHGTGKLCFTDNDDIEAWPADRNTVTVVSGSGDSAHQTFINDGTVENAKAGGAGSLRAENWYVVAPGSIHPSGGIYHLEYNPGLIELSSEDLPDELKSSTDTSGSPERVDIDSLDGDFVSDEVKNSWDDPRTLGEIRQVSSKLDGLLKMFNPGGKYPSTSEADMATVSMLLHWGFDEDDIADILKDCRGRRKLKRDDYVQDTIHRTSRTEKHPVDPQLGPVVVDEALDNGGKPPVSPNNIQLAVSALQGLGGRASTADLAESGIVPWGDEKFDSVKRRVRRAMKLLDKAGYVSYENTGRSGDWINEDLDSFKSGWNMS